MISHEPQTCSFYFHSVPLSLPQSRPDPTSSNNCVIIHSIVHVKSHFSGIIIYGRPPCPPITSFLMGYLFCLSFGQRAEGGPLANGTLFPYPTQDMIRWLNEYIAWLLVLVMI
jgi:hypothetical protein